MRLVRLCEIADAVRGVSFASSDAVAQPGPDLVACITTSGVHTPVRWSTACYIPLRLVGNSQLLRVGDILVSTANSAAAVGKSVLVDALPSTAAFGAFVTVIRPKPGVDPAYLSMWMQTDHFKSTARALASQTTNIANLRTSDLLAMAVPLEADLRVQTRTVAAFRAGTAQALQIKESVAAQVRATRHLRDATLTAAFAALPGPCVQLHRAVASPGAITDGPFGSNLKSIHYVASGVRVIRLGNIGPGRFLDDDQAFISEEHFRGLGRHDAHTGDVLVAALGDGARPAGRACLVPASIGPALVKADCFRVRTAGSGIDAEYLMDYLNSPIALEEAANSSRGATRPRMTLAMLKNFSIPLPSVHEQRRIAAELRERLATIDQMTRAINAQLEAIEALPAALLRRAFAEIEAA